MKIPETPPDFAMLLMEASSDRLSEIVRLQIGPAPGGKYRHWDTLRRIKPPAGLTAEQYWLAQKLARLNMRRVIPGLLDREGQPFYYSLPDPLLQMLHEVSKEASGQLQTGESLPDTAAADTFIRRSLIEEAISSSQLEGAATTRVVAKEMIKTGRKPRTRGEKMILNNYFAMNHIRELRSRPLSVEFIEEIHSILTAETTDIPATYRVSGDGVGVYDSRSNLLLFSPPNASESRERLDALCRFANSEDDVVFMHPAVKAIILHFWFAYIHPFTDGNGRTARALFYWYMLQKDFWLIEYISISRILKRAPARYGKAYLYSETDDNDVTYFILNQLRVILRAVEDLQKYLVAKSKQLEDVSELIKPGGFFNRRQMALLSHALRNPKTVFTIESHRNGHGITYQTSRTDLLTLAKLSLLNKSTSGRKYVFRVADDLTGRLKKLRPESPTSPP